MFLSSPATFGGVALTSVGSYAAVVWKIRGEGNAWQRSRRGYLPGGSPNCTDLGYLFLELPPLKDTRILINLLRILMKANLARCTTVSTVV